MLRDESTALIDSVRLSGLVITPTKHSEFQWSET